MTTRRLTGAEGSIGGDVVADWFLVVEEVESARLRAPLGLTRPVPCTRPPPLARMVPPLVRRVVESDFCANE
jgi:hypothetical protein